MEKLETAVKNCEWCHFQVIESFLSFSIFFLKSHDLSSINCVELKKSKFTMRNFNGNLIKRAAQGLLKMMQIFYVKQAD
jgi:hypothetical protein